MLVEAEIAVAMIGSRRVIGPGLRNCNRTWSAELHELGLIAHERGCKCSVVSLLERWRRLHSIKAAVIASSLARVRPATSAATVLRPASSAKCSV
jgi:hypothetical protein